MSSKNTKSRKESKGTKKPHGKKSYEHELVAPDCWVNELAEININDVSWKCSVTIIEEESTDSSVYMEHFNEATIDGNRLSIKSISKLEVIHYVVKNMAENQPSKSFTPLTILCSEIFKLVGPEFTNKIPTPLLASLIKYLVLDYKDLNNTIRGGIQKRKKDIEEFQQSLWKTPVKSISSKGTKSSKLENKSNKPDKVTKIKTIDKPFTKLRKRGEEWKDKTWKDDSPQDGPQLYIAISTFYDPDLPLELLRLNIPLHAIAKLSLWETNSTPRTKVSSVPTDLKDIFHSLQSFRQKSTPHLNSTIRKRLGNAQISYVKISSFWNTIKKFKTKLPTALMFKDVMFLSFTPEHLCFKYDIKSFQEEIYKQISYFLYDVHEITKQHIQYLSEIKQTNVHTSESFDLSNMKIYNSLLDSVPNELCSIPFLLDAIVIQVCGLEHEEGQQETLLEIGKTNEKSIPVASNYLTKLLKQLNLKYDMFENPFNCNVFNEGESINDIYSCNIKHVLKHFDDTKIKTFHLKEDIAEFARNRIAHILKVAWNDILLNFFSVPLDNKTIKLCSEVIQTAKESDESALNYYIYILTVNSILNSLLMLHNFPNSILKTNLLKGSEVNYERESISEDSIIEAHNETFSIASILRSTISNLNSISCNVSNPKMNNDIVESSFSYVEYMTMDVMLQWIQKALYHFNKCETRYCPFTNQVVIVFHNLFDQENGVFEEHWIGKLTTYVPIRDFVEYILEEEKNWLSQFHSKSSDESLKVDKAVTFYIDKLLLDELYILFPEHQFISHRSLKYETNLKQQKYENKLAEKIKSPKTKTISKQSDSSIKSKEKPKKKEKKLSENKRVSVDSLKEETPKENFTFIGYDLGDPMRFQFSGLKKETILDGCCRITLQTIEKLYGEKSQALTVTISDHSLYYMYKPYCESTLINPFHLILSSGIVIYFGLSNEHNTKTGSIDQIPKSINRRSTKESSLLIDNNVLETEFISHQTGENTELLGSNDLISNEMNSSRCFPHTTLKGVPYVEIPLTYDLKISLPNGLHIKLAKESGLFYIKQTLLTRSMLSKSVEKDKLRCYLSNGCIIKFLLNDTVEVLSSTGYVYTVFAVKDEPVSSEKEEATSSTEGTTPKPTHDKEIEKNTNLTNTFYFGCTTSDGKRFTAQDDKVTEVFKDLLISHTVNVADNCIDSERTDRVLTKHQADGSLIVQFTDGSRITSTPLEVGEVFCEWSSEELNQWFCNSSETTVLAADLQTEKSFSTTSQSNYTEKSLISRKTENTMSAMESFHKADNIQSDVLPNEHEKELKVSLLEESHVKSDLETIISKTSTGTLVTSPTNQNALKKPFYHDDGFVVYHVSYLMEHPNYSSVYYNANKCEVELKLPFNTKITLKNDGCYEGHFDQANLTVDYDEIYFGKTSESGDFERTIIINNSTTNNKTPINVSNYFNRMNSLPHSVDEFCQSIGMKSLLRGMVMKNDIKNGLLLYCVDAKTNEIIVDYDFNIYKFPLQEDNYSINGSSFTAMVINDNFSGFRFVSDEEAKSHLKVITEKRGLLQVTDNTWKSLLTTVPVVTNESEKWLMNYEKNLTEKIKILLTTSTYGKRESWIQPFVEKEENLQDLVGYTAVIVRLLHKIPAQDTILDKLKVAVTNYTRKTSKNYNTKIFLDEAGVASLSLDEFIRNPKLLCKLVKDEITKQSIQEDSFRRDMKHDFLHLLINKAIITARKIRKQNELKSALRRREIPPYHLSGYGYVHSILDEVFEKSTNVCISSSSTSSCEKVNFIIDELLSLVGNTKLGSTDKKLESDTIINETDSIGIKSLVSSIFRNVCATTQGRNSQVDINVIMEKPLKLVTSDDIEFISKMCGLGDCPLFGHEEFILQDVLDARLQLYNYFENMRAMLEFYRGISTAQ